MLFRLYVKYHTFIYEGERSSYKNRLSFSNDFAEEVGFCSSVIHGCSRKTIFSMEKLRKSELVSTKYFFAWNTFRCIGFVERDRLFTCYQIYYLWNYLIKVQNDKMKYGQPTNRFIQITGMRETRKRWFFKQCNQTNIGNTSTTRRGLQNVFS